jgi:hypothetical protein
MLRKIMLAKIMLACVAAAVVAVVALPTEASARGRGGGGWHGGGHGGWHGGGGFRRGWGGPRLGFYPSYGGYSYGAYGCYRTVRVFTPYGPSLRRVWVCG